MMYSRTNLNRIFLLAIITFVVLTVYQSIRRSDVSSDSPQPQTFKRVDNMPTVISHPPSDNLPFNSTPSSHYDSPYIRSALSFQNDPEYIKPGSVKAAIVILCRNSEYSQLVNTLIQFEYVFNSKYNYPYVFLNNVPFTEEFKKGVQKITRARVKFGLVPRRHWEYPDWVNQTYAKECRDDLQRKNIIYGGSESYRFMCRYYSGFFYKHPLLQQYDYFWRVEPGVQFTCNINEDPFSAMASRNKIYGFTISLFELRDTIPTLWQTVKQYMKTYPNDIPEHNTLKFAWNERNGDYNGCHFWTNFEIADLRFFRSEKYNRFFDYLDSTGKFFYERWGDAPVHSIAAALFLSPDQIHFFENIGYKHDPFQHCPLSIETQVASECTCGADESFDFKPHSCLRWYYYAVKQALKGRFVNWKAALLKGD
ncbi:nucleotide-diphospho-sugar transferase [Paraphysoderma sedebokerense]|nr:nucleotide-diphospho-sugar transferase [Paraphysoderma sedebokerense]